MEKKSYLSTFNGAIIFKSEDVLAACGFSLELHKASNVPHLIEVRSSDDMDNFILHLEA